MLYLTLAVIGLVILLVTIIFDDFLDFLGFDSPFLSGLSIGAFLAGFGFAGPLVPQSWTTGGTALVALAVGASLAIIAGLASKTLRDSPTDANISSTTVMGSRGSVITEIVDGSYGQVIVNVAGHTNKYAAKADTPLAAGTPVEVVAILSASSVRVAAITD